MPDFNSEFGLFGIVMRGSDAPHDFEPSFLGSSVADFSAKRTVRTQANGSGRSALKTSGGVSMAASEEGIQASRVEPAPCCSGELAASLSQFL